MTLNIAHSWFASTQSYRLFLSLQTVFLLNPIGHSLLALFAPLLEYPRRTILGRVQARLSAHRGKCRNCEPVPLCSFRFSQIISISASLWLPAWSLVSLSGRFSLLESLLASSLCLVQSPYWVSCEFYVGTMSYPNTLQVYNHHTVRLSGGFSMLTRHGALIFCRANVSFITLARCFA